MNGSNNSGFTLTELAIATSIGMLAVAGALKVYSESRAYFRTLQNITDLEQRAVFALRLLDQDIARAGYFGLHADGRLLATDADVSVQCAGLDVADWATATENPVAGSNAAYELPCPPRFAPVPGTDTLTLRFADSEPAAANARGAIVVTGLEGGVIASQADRPIDADVIARRQLRITAWYLGAGSSEQPSPALYRQRLRDDGQIETQEIMPGIEDLQIRFGFDTNSDGLADELTNAGTQLMDDAIPVSVQVQLRLGTALPEQGHIDTGPWISIDPNEPHFLPDDRQRRISVTRSFAIRNHPGAI
jgi:type IV pilus assembly protein PilW